jgi:hypothetical protein
LFRGAKVSAPILKFRPGCLTGPIRLDLAVIEAWMLWPENDQAHERSQALQTNISECIKIVLPSLPDDMVRAFIPVTADAPRLADIHKVICKKIQYGLVAGKILLGTLKSISQSPAQASMKEVKKRIAAYKLAGMGEKNIQRQWEKYRRVSHLWAAYLHNGIAENDLAFPCRVDQLRDFAEAADWFRRAGETMRTMQHPKEAILERDECLLFPPEMGLREFPIRVGG